MVLATLQCNYNLWEPINLNLGVASKLKGLVGFDQVLEKMTAVLAWLLIPPGLWTNTVGWSIDL